MQVFDLRAGCASTAQSIASVRGRCKKKAAPDLSIPVQQMDTNSKPAHAGGSLGAQANSHATFASGMEQTVSMRLHTTVDEDSMWPPLVSPSAPCTAPERTQNSLANPVERIAQGFRLIEMANKETPPSRALPEPMPAIQGHCVGSASTVPFSGPVQKHLH
ncbi:hypothetical protein BKA56DRAFT_611940 [Ilyonectria sp. MPI-CAGE-AT-0026]|nr:hypothetical protein BKA56DRAFT_611940 [Ilyonectria sp. MPI-CAGE-AT-0026]